MINRNTETNLSIEIYHHIGVPIQKICIENILQKSEDIVQRLRRNTSSQIQSYAFFNGLNAVEARIVERRRVREA